MPQQDKIEVGEYSTADGRILNIYATYRRGGMNFYRTVIEPGWGFNLDVDGHGRLWFWPDWDKFAGEVNKIAGEPILASEDNPLIIPDEEEVVEEWACPDCGERRIDRLVIDPEDKREDDKVKCSSCGCVYWLTW